MDFNRLYTFIKVAERGNITKAAADLYLTQQAVSKQLLLLEDELQLQLFIRTHNSIHLTRDGQELVTQMSPLFQKMGECISTLQGKVGELGGVIRLGASVGPDSMPLFLSIVKSFKNKFPNVRFELVFEIDYAIEDKIIANELDIGVLSVYRDQRILKSERILSKKALLCCTEQFQQNYGPFQQYSDLFGVPFAEFTHNFAGFGRWMKVNCPNDVKLFMSQQPEIVAESSTAVIDFVISGMCMGFIPEELFVSLKKEKQLVQLFPDAEPIIYDLFYVTKTKETERIIEKEFKEHLFTNWLEVE